MPAALRGDWNAAARYQRFLYAVGAVLLASAAFHLGVLIATGGSWEGPLSWRKPILFGESFGLTGLSVGWILGFLPRRPVLGWLLAGNLGVAILGEVAWVSMQQWRGVPSHFNFATSFDTAVFGVAGLLILLTSLSLAPLTIWAFLSLAAPPSLVWAIRIGLVLLLAAQAFGFFIIFNGNSRVIDPRTGDFLPAMLDRAATFGARGAMKVPHALSLHAVQVLPALAWVLLFTRLHEDRRTAVVLAASAGYAMLVAVSSAQTLRGRAPLDLDPAMLLALGAGVGALGGAWAVAALGLRRD